MKKYLATGFIPFSYNIVGVFGDYIIIKDNDNEYLVPLYKDAIYGPYNSIKCKAIGTVSNASYLFFCYRNENVALDSIDLVNKEILDIYDMSKDSDLIGSYIIINEYNQGNIKILKSLKTGKYHIVNCNILNNLTFSNYSQTLEKFYKLFNEEYDDYEVIQFSPTILGIVLSKDGKYDFYWGQDFSYLTFEYDAVEAVSNHKDDNDLTEAIILKKGKQKYLLNNNLGSSYWQKVDKPYEEIELLNNDYFACYSNGEIDLVKGSKIIFTTNADKRIIKSLSRESDDNNTLYFVYEKDGKLGLLCKSGKKVKILTKPLYDDIRYDTDLGLFIFKQEDTISLFDGYRKVASLDCDDISLLTNIGGNLYVLLHHQDKADIYDLINSKTLKKDINIDKDKVHTGWQKNSFIYKKDNKYGIFSIIVDDSNKKNVVSFKDTGPIYDSIEYIDLGIYIITEDNKQGLLVGDEVVIKPEYQSISSKHFPGNSLWEKSQYLFIAKTIDKEEDKLFWVELASEKNENKTKLHFFEYLHFFNYHSLSYQPKMNIDFVDKLIVFDIDDNGNKYTYIYGFDKNFTYLSHYDGEVKITPSTKKVSSYDDHISLYDALWTSEKEQKSCTLAYIKDNRYSVKRLVTLPSFDKEIFMTAYDFSEGIIVVNSESETEHLKKCSSIESLDEDEVNATLKKLNEKVLKKERK